MNEAERITRAKKKEYLKHYYAAHRAEIRAKQAKYYEEHKEERKKASNDYYRRKCMAQYEMT